MLPCMAGGYPTPDITCHSDDGEVWPQQSQGQLAAQGALHQARAGTRALALTRMPMCSPLAPSSVSLRRTSSRTDA